MSKINYWTKEEVEILRFNANKLTVNDFVYLLPKRSKEAIRKKLKDLDIPYIQEQVRWNSKDIDTLLKCDGLKFYEVQSKLPHRSKENIWKKANELNVNILLSNSWTPEEDEILIINSNGKMHPNEISKLLINRTPKAVKSRMSKLGLKYVNNERKGITKNKNFNTKVAVEYRYKTKFGIMLDYDKGIYTYDSVQWWKFLYYGTPNGKKLSTLPIELYKNDDELLKIMQYVLLSELNYSCREDFLSLTLDNFKEYKIYFKRMFKDGICNLLNLIFPEYNFRPFEFNNVPLGYWENIGNCDEYMRYLIEEVIDVKQFLDIKKEIPPIFTFTMLRKLKHYPITYAISVYRHYECFYDWLNKLYPEWELTPDDFSESRGFDGIRLNSKEEVIIYNLLKRDLKLNVKAVGMHKKFKFYDELNNVNYIPDFIIEFDGKIIIVEYFGLYRKNYGKSKILKDYYYKTIDKIKYFSDLEGYDFIYIFQNEIDDLENIKSKVMSLLRR